MGSLLRIRTAFCLALLFVTLGAGAGPVVRDRKAARQAFGKASEYLKQLHAVPLQERSARQYDRAIYLFRRVVDHDPSYGACDDALYQAARLYDEKAQRFARQGDRKKAIHYYRFVAREYPLTKHRQAALKRADYLESNPPASAKASPKAASKSVSAKAARGNPKATASQPATVDKIRYWSGPSYTRVVVDLDREVEFEKVTLHNPYRVYMDLLNSRLRPGVPETHAVNDVLIKNVRVAPNRPGVIRVVLNFAQAGESTVFPLYDPFRIVIDTRSPNEKGASQKAGKTASAEISLDEGSAAATAPSPPAPDMDGNYTLTRTLGLKVGRVALDPGHGGHDHGAVGPGGLREKDLVLDVARQLKKLLEERLQTEVVLTRTSDRFIPLEERTAIANQKGADLFISIHANSSRSRRASGIETFYLNFATTTHEREVASRENATSQRTIGQLEDILRQIAKGDYNEESRSLAHVVQQNLRQGLSPHRKFRDRGVKRAPFIVLIGSNMPAILTEIGFVSNPDEEGFLHRKKSRGQVAEALFQGIEDYFRSLGSAPSESASDENSR